MTTKKPTPNKKSPAKKKAAPKKTTDQWVEVDPKTSPEDLTAMVTGGKPITKRKTVKKKATPKKKAPARIMGGTALMMSPKKKTTPAKKRAATKKPEKPIPKYHLDGKNWDKLAVMDVIFEKMINSSLGLAYVCKENPDLPNVGTIFRWMNDEQISGGDTVICDMYARAKDIQMDFLADETIDICDNPVGNPVMIDNVPLMDKEGNPVRIIDNASIQWAKLRSDNRKWIAAKLKHRKYGDKLELSGDPERPLSGMTDEQLAARAKQLQEQLANGAE